MSISDVDIANLALVKLGQSAIASFTDNNKNAKTINSVYTMLRDKLQRRRWNFNRKYVQLPVLSVQPPFEYPYAYALPNDYLRLELATQALQANTNTSVTNSDGTVTITATPGPSLMELPGTSGGDINNSRFQAYRIVGKQIWSYAGPPLACIYGAREEDPNKFDSFFVEAFAAYLAWQICDAITGSGARKQELRDEYKESMTEALMMKSIELPPEQIPDDTWMLSRLND